MTDTDDAPDDAQEVKPSIQVTRWRDSADKVMAGITGKQTLWLLGEPVRVVRYVHLERARLVLSTVALALILWKLWALAADVHAMMLREMHR